MATRVRQQAKPKVKPGPKPSGLDGHADRLYWAGGVNDSARWVGECVCGYTTGLQYHPDALTGLQAHIVGCSSNRAVYASKA